MEKELGGCVAGLVTILGACGLIAAGLVSLPVIIVFGVIVLACVGADQGSGVSSSPRVNPENDAESECARKIAKQWRNHHLPGEQGVDISFASGLDEGPFSQPETRTYRFRLEDDD